METNQKNNKELLRIIAIVVVCLEVFFFTLEEGLDLGFSHEVVFSSKLLFALLRV